MSADEDRPMRCGPFELDPGSRELRSATGRLRLQEQPFVILQMLLERRGQVVTREELRQRLWPAGTFVDFEHSLNAAIKRLRAALGDDADNPQFVETIPRRGYRFVADPDGSDESAAGVAQYRVRLAVLPFTELGLDGQDDYFSQGFTEEMISELGRRCRGRVGVISSHSSTTFRHTSARARDIGTALRADYLLEGSVRRNEGRVRITARLVETARETQLWVDTYEQPLADWLSAQTEIATRIAQSLAMELAPDGSGTAVFSHNPAAYQSYVKGRYHWQRPADSGADEALRFFRDAVAKDPSFAAAHAGVAIVEAMRASYYHEVPRVALERARGSAERAVQLDPNLAEAHLAVGEVKRTLLWDARGARAALTRAIALNPSFESARGAHARLLASLGRFAQAVREADLARELDPRCLSANTLAAWTRYVAGDYDAAVALCRHTLEMDEAILGTRLLLGAALLAADSPKEALRVLESAIDSTAPNPVAVAWLAHARAVTNDRRGAAELIARLGTLAPRRYVSPCHLALAHAGLGDLGGAFDALERGCEDRDPAIMNVAADPRFAPLRTHARYRPLLLRVGMVDSLSSSPEAFPVTAR
jgi:TolB-like protein